MADDINLQVYDNYNDVKEDDMIDAAMYFGKGVDSLHIQVEAAKIIKDYMYIGDVLPW